MYKIFIDDLNKIYFQTILDFILTFATFKLHSHPKHLIIIKKKIFRSFQWPIFTSVKEENSFPGILKNPLQPNQLSSLTITWSDKLTTINVIVRKKTNELKRNFKLNWLKKIWKFWHLSTELGKKKPKSISCKMNFSNSETFKPLL